MYLATRINCTVATNLNVDKATVWRNVKLFNETTGQVSKKGLFKRASIQEAHTTARANAMRILHRTHKPLPDFDQLLVAMSSNLNSCAGNVQ